MKLLYTGPLVTAELLIVMLEKHGIPASQQFEEAGAIDDGDLARPTKVMVAEENYERSYQLFYSEREDEL